MYEWDGVSWVQLGLDIDGEAADDRSGGSVSLSSDGSRLAIGAIWNDGNGLMLVMFVCMSSIHLLDF